MFSRSSSSLLRSNMFSRACMLESDSPTEAGSLPSQRSACMGPCSSLFTIPLLRSSSTRLSFFESPSPTLFMAFSSSVRRMSSALLRSFLMVGTVSSESLHASYPFSSSTIKVSASAAAAARCALFASTTSFKSSTLKARALSRSLMAGSMFLGTEMSKKRRVPPTVASGHAGIAATSSLVIRIESELEAAKMTSDSATLCIRLGESSKVNSTSGNSSCSSRHRGMLRFTTVILLHPLDERCFTSSLDIFPAPTMHTRQSSKELEGSLSWASSAAALETETAPDAMSVSLRTRLPAWIACLNSVFRWRPKPPCLSSASYSVPRRCTFLTCARIWPSPMTRESRPPLTRRRCRMASRSRRRKRCGLSSSMGRPLFLESQSSISFTPRCQLRPTAYSSMRLHVDRMHASLMCG
mmetsp:Transcript_3775/g.9533  ORF Transcript_3775/g.9533 Transcript_3775/m.9533 type:complete len:411 (-) Transcript_3775:678-1910(-)